jgi:uncharacterized membrane protein (UPF0127 family)
MTLLRISTENGALVAGRVEQARTWRARARGWLGKASAESGEGLLLSPAASIHTFGMAFPIDVAFLDAESRVLKVCPDVRPGSVRWGLWWGLFANGSVQTLELPAGAAAGLKPGMKLTLEKAPA